MKLVNGWLLVRMDDKRGVQLGSGQVIAGDDYLDCKIVFTYKVGFSYNVQNHPDPHMFINKADIICVLDCPEEEPKIITKDPKFLVD